MLLILFLAKFRMFFAYVLSYSTRFTYYNLCTHPSTSSGCLYIILCILFFSTISSSASSCTIYSQKVLLLKLFCYSWLYTYSSFLSWMYLLILFHPAFLFNCSPETNLAAKNRFRWTVNCQLSLIDNLHHIFPICLYTFKQ